jgi:ABC-type transporter MlaC component
VKLKAVAKRVFADGRKTSDRMLVSRIQESLYAEIEILAVKNEVTISTIVREALAKYVSEQKAAEIMLGKIPKTVSSREVQSSVGTKQHKSMHF